MNIIRVLTPALLGASLALAASPEQTTTSVVPQEPSGVATLPELRGVPYSSVGSLEATRQQSASAMGLEVSWSINHPTKLADIVLVDPQTGSLTTRTELRVRIHVLGVGKKGNHSPHQVGLWTSIGLSENWELLFCGDSESVLARKALLDRTVPTNTRINLAGRAHGGIGKSWFAPRWTLASDPMVSGKTNGAPAPSVIRQNPESYLSAFLSGTPDESGTRSVMIGPKEMIFFFELVAETPDEAGFDMQDLAVLVSFEEE